MSEKPAEGGRGRGGGGRGKGRVRGGRGGGGRGNKQKPKEGGEAAAAKSNDTNSQQQEPSKRGGRVDKGRGRGADTDANSAAGSAANANKGRNRRGNNNNNNNNKGKAGGGNQKGGNKANAKTVEPQKSEEEKKREEQEKLEREQAEALNRQQEAERRALEAAKEAHRQQQAALNDKIQEAMDGLQTLVETTQLHRERRVMLQAEALAKARKAFQDNKKNLKTDLKKCTAFVKKVKTGGAWSMKADEIRREVSTLNLSRYVEEVVAALLDSRLKLPDLPMVVTLSTEMHLRYPDFLNGLLPGLWGVIHGKPTEETSKTRRLYVRLLTDFVLNGLIVDTKPLVKLITEATGGKDGSYNVTDANLIVAFGKAAGFEIFGKKPRSIQDHISLIRKEADRSNEASIQKAEVVADEGDPPSTNPASSAESQPIVITTELAQKALEIAEKAEETMFDLAVSAEISEIFTTHCVGAFETLSNSLVATHNKLQKLEKRCEQDRLLSGALPEAREKGLNDARKLLDSLQKSVDTFADVLDQPLPQLEVEDNDGDANAGSGGLEVWTKSGGDGGTGDFGPFDDEETRAFYFDIPDLLTTVPPGLLGISPEEIERRRAENIQKYGAGFESLGVDEGEIPEDEGFTSVAQLEELEEPSAPAEGDGENQEENKDTPHYKLTVLLEQELPECNRREQIDEITEKFCTNQGSSKNSRKRLSKTLFQVPRTRLDLLPYYSRMTAILDRIWTDIAPPLVKELEQQFHGQTKFKKNQNIDSRMKTARYIGELTKFRVAPPIVALRCLKRCCDDFSGANIDVACCMLESCGRYLHRVKHTSARLTQIMETMTRLSKAADLDERSQSLIKAAFFTVQPPPSGPKKQAKEYSPLETYLRYLLLDRLEPDPASVSFVSKQIIRLPWNDPSTMCGSLVCKIMLKTCRKGRYKAIHALAAVSANLRRHRPEVSIRLIDALIEELRWAIEHPNFRDQQRIISYTRLLGELFCVSLVSGQLIIQQLYNFVNFGHEIPASLREASEKHQESMAAGAATSEGGDKKQQLPVYNSAGGAVQAINEDEEMEEAGLATKEEEEATQNQPVAVSRYSMYDPRVPSPADPPNSAFRVKLICTLLEVVAQNIVTRNNLPKLKGFLAAFQRYLFTKTMLPAEVEFSLLDTFDAVDSVWRKAVKDQSGKGPRAKKDSGVDGEGDGGNKEELGFTRYANWLEAHNATVATEEADHLAEVKTRARAEAMAGESSAEGMDTMDGELLDDDFMGDDDDDDSSEDPMSLSAKDSVADDHHYEIESGDEDGGDENMEQSRGDESSDEDSEESNESDGDSEDDDSEDDEFDEEEYRRRMEEEAFERELRRVTMEALEKGKVASRGATGGKVADTMPSGSQIIKKKVLDPAATASPSNAPTVLGGGTGISFQLLKKGHKGKLEAKELIVPADTNLAKVATKQDDKAARERDMIKARVLQYEAESAEAGQSGGNVYLEQEKLQVIRNRPLSMDDIDRNFGTSGGNLRQDAADRPRTSPSVGGRGGGPSASGMRSSAGRGRGRGGRGRGNPSGRSLYG